MNFDSNIDPKKDYWGVLGLSPGASIEDVKKRYKELAKKYHPDLNPDDPEAENKFKIINEAADILKDDEKRQQFEMMRRYGVGGSAGSTNSFRSGGFRHAGQGSFRNRAGVDYMFFGDPSIMDIDQILRSQFGTGYAGFGEGNPNGGRQHFNPNQKVNISIGLADAYTGITQTVKYRTRNGEDKEIQVTIPPGIESGEMIRYAGKGECIIKNLPAGDLFIVVNIQEHQNFSREKSILHSNLKVPLADAMCGGKKEFQMLNGLIVEVTIPPGIQSGTVMRLRGKGMPNKHNPKVFGDLFLKIKIEIPKLSKEKAESIREILNES